MFTKSDIRTGVLPQMLKEILQTRVMVKNAMKSAKNDKVTLRNCLIKSNFTES